MTICHTMLSYYTALIILKVAVSLQISFPLADVEGRPDVKGILTEDVEDMWTGWPMSRAG